MLSAKQIMDYVQAIKTVSETKLFSFDEAKQIGDTLGVRWDTFDVQQFTIGLNVELEHGRKNAQTDVTHDAPWLTGKIALAHLEEFPDYYTRLAAMKHEAEGGKGTSSQAILTEVRRLYEE
jgi:hypothetical protein